MQDPPKFKAPGPPFEPFHCDRCGAVIVQCSVCRNTPHELEAVGYWLHITLGRAWWGSEASHVCAICAATITDQLALKQRLVAAEASTAQ